jgi:hypothetical protein
VPPPPGPLAAIVTTEGTTWSATEVTGQALAVDEAAEVPGLTLEPDDCVAPTIRPPTTPPMTSAVPSQPQQPPPWASRMPGNTHTGSLSGPLKTQWSLGKDTSPAQLSHRLAAPVVCGRSFPGSSENAGF